VRGELGEQHPDGSQPDDAGALPGLQPGLPRGVHCHGQPVQKNGLLEGDGIGQVVVEVLPHFELLGHAARVMRHFRPAAGMPDVLDLSAEVLPPGAAVQALAAALEGQDADATLAAVFQDDACHLVAKNYSRRAGYVPPEGVQAPGVFARQVSQVAAADAAGLHSDPDRRPRYPRNRDPSHLQVLRPRQYHRERFLH